jgi:hypothetical protein
MARIVLGPAWVGVLDFQSRFPVAPSQLVWPGRTAREHLRPAIGACCELLTGYWSSAR